MDGYNDELKDGCHPMDGYIRHELKDGCHTMDGYNVMS